MSAEPLSHWGWGYADRFPDRRTRAGFAEHAATLLGFEGLTVEDPMAFDAIELSSPRIAPPAALADVCTTDKRQRVTHTYGKAYRDVLRGFRGDFGAAPDVVARPLTEAQVVDVLDWAGENGVAVIPFGGGTGVVGGVEAAPSGGYAGVVSLDTRGLNQVLEVDPVSRAARIQAGATGPALEGQLAESGLTLRHYPQSFEFSTLGGWIATRSGGHYATLYTHVDEFVESLRMVTPAGVMESRRLPGSGAGPSPDRLMIGSEGALGVITEAWMRVQDRPRYRWNASVHFSDFAAAVAATREVAQAGLFPTNCRLLDAREARLHGVCTDGSNVLLLGFESADHPPDAWLDRAMAIVASHGGRCPAGVIRRDDQRAAEADSAAHWREAFFDAPYQLNVMVSLGLIADTFETACTWDRFETLHGAVIGAVRAAMKRACGQGFISCRFTHVYPDGPAPYYTFLAPGRRGGELEQWAEIKAAASETLLAHGATITHHHAVGRVHRPWYDRQRPEPFAAALTAAKKALDPAGILNPGVLLDARI